LAAAIRLRARGYRVTVLEKLDAPGGRAYVHRQDGFTFDAGPTIITAPFLFEELWALCGRRMADDIDLRLMQPFYRVRFDDGSWFDYRGDPASMREEVARFARPTWRATTASCAKPSSATSSASRTWPTRPSTPWRPDQRRAIDGLDAGLAFAARDGRLAPSATRSCAS
jgi:phytoene dehydrogenase-like protein